MCLTLVHSKQTIDELVDNKLRLPTYDLMTRNVGTMQEQTSTEVPQLTERAMLEEVDPMYRPILSSGSQGIVANFANNCESSAGFELLDTWDSIRLFLFFSVRAVLVTIVRGIPETLVDVAMNIVKVLGKTVGGTALTAGFGAALNLAGKILSNPYAAIVPQIIMGVQQKVREILTNLIQPIMQIIPTTFDNAARGIIQGLLNSGNALLTAATLVFGGMAYEKIRDSVMNIVQPKAWGVVGTVMQRTEGTIMNEFEGQVNKVFGGKPSSGLSMDGQQVQGVFDPQGHPMYFRQLNPQQAPYYDCDRCRQRRDNSQAEIHARCDRWLVDLAGAG